MDRLSTQQRRCIDLAVAGLPTKRIATSTGLAPNTVRVHLCLAYRKLGVRGKLDLMARMLADRA